MHLLFESKLHIIELQDYLLISNIPIVTFTSPPAKQISLL
jgi:hypothetical protein